MKKTVLLVDDEPDILELLDITLSRMGLDCLRAENIESARQQLVKRSPDLCLTDMRLPDGNGLDLVKHIQQHFQNTPIAVITAHGNVDIAIESMKAGAFDFLSKPIDLERLRTLVSTALKLGEEAASNDELILGQTPAIRHLNTQITKLARSQAPVLITGESGSGKELIARSIHLKGPRNAEPFIAVNCGAIPKDLMESEFFGHKKGTFTGATADKLGMFQAAQGGTLFLDEVADLPLDMQVKLLRAIQEKAVRPVGAQKEEAIDVRILSATHKNLQREVENGNFRQDLYYRINVIEVQSPALRERAEDLPLLTNKILHKIANTHGAKTARITEKALEKLKHYSFPGNVRELENILERAYTLCENDTIDISDLQLSEPESTTATDNTLAPSTPSMHAGTSLDTYLADIEKEVIIDALERCKWNRTLTAKQLGISFRSLRYRLKKLGLE
ncbi:sigma-54-dependent transcriptional regulator [Simiduia agarivorans]|uniref:Type 4 fimbriae expression regulatory protein pilR n=1 Tax=Simiduia agarivorans (strain DSM 21679 / JCM 13881 / BCRC 17597 / SA1) TaxID=1117647 RepID=K4KLH3_SIMAS|nr:sigma-54 dependent transcriptional regulator [Simiduia agarivorans]AFU98913.1 Type 4 fimbriae expression regulatory protein pilR [Simiduia agarivorans SA1 = DSM 21679]